MPFRLGLIVLRFHSSKLTENFGCGASATVTIVMLAAKGAEVLLIDSIAVLISFCRFGAKPHDSSYSRFTIQTFIRRIDL
jgi:hypothetical protein